MIKLNYSKSMVKEEEISSFKEFVKSAHYKLHLKSGLGNDYVGWVDYPIEVSKKELERIKSVSEKIVSDSDALVVIGIGGSYLGARATIEALSHSFYNSLSNDQRKTPEIYYAGNNISGKYLHDLIDVLETKNFSINVISKSGTTTEPAIAFRTLKKLLEKKYGKENAKKRIYATTDSSKGALKNLSDKEGYETFVIPDDVGGRYSVLTPVGLLPIAVSGIDITKLLEGAISAREEYMNENIDENICYQYAAIRNILYNRGKSTEIMVNYEPSLHYLGEWWKQLFGESEGKDNKGIFPAAVDFSTDLHSMGQYIQDGRRNLMETVIKVNDTGLDMSISEDEANLDGLNYLCSKTMNDVNEKAFEGTLLAHYDGNVPNVIIELEKLDVFTFGKLLYFFEKACGISGYLLGVNPFNQPGVEAYKKNMFALLNKPGYEELGEILRKKL
ncbi:glucose-6-phosphate isomerase [Helicovermis profundi]|uniref:Glucose-6-phosphate isomerase n=1 Tax=Helicovermis profundi TaxID=3065157 RepID=A0AAU9EI03_9FIRM|nr:glucose-6-phosphate isomerase [Clostridia bacterium S502]